MSTGCIFCLNKTAYLEVEYQLLIKGSHLNENCCYRIGPHSLKASSLGQDNSHNFSCQGIGAVSAMPIWQTTSLGPASRDGNLDYCPKTDTVPTGEFHCMCNALIGASGKGGVDERERERCLSPQGLRGTKSVPHPVAAVGYLRSCGELRDFRGHKTANFIVPIVLSAQLRHSEMEVKIPLCV